MVKIEAEGSDFKDALRKLTGPLLKPEIAVTWRSTPDVMLPRENPAHGCYVQLKGDIQREFQTMNDALEFIKAHLLEREKFVSGVLSGEIKRNPYA